MMGTNELTTLLITLAVAIGLFLLLRGINLWYWRINEIITNQEKQINQMASLLAKFDNGNANPKQTTPKKVIATKNKSINDLYKKDNSSVTVKVKATGKVENWKKEDWEEVVRLGNEEKFELL